MKFRFVIFAALFLAGSLAFSAQEVKTLGLAAQGIDKKSRHDHGVWLSSRAFLSASIMRRPSQSLCSGRRPTFSQVLCKSLLKSRRSFFSIR